MALAPAIAAALNVGLTPRRLALWLDGLDVALQPAAGGNRYGVDPGSIDITEQGAGGVSMMSFEVEDPQLAVAIDQGGARVLAWDLANDVPAFRGFVQSVQLEAAAGDQGRLYRVQCIGPESLLDWYCVRTAMTFAAGTELAAVVQGIVANGLEHEIRALNWPASAGSNASTQAVPMERANPADAIVDALTLDAGTSLRTAIRQACQLVPSPGIYGAGVAITGIQVSIDYWLGLRLYTGLQGGGGFLPATSIVVNDDSTALANQGEPTIHGWDSAIYRSVLVRGTGVSVLVTDGSGRPGPRAILDDSTITTAAGAQAAGAAYLRPYGATYRGTIAYVDRAWTDLRPAASTVQITDTRLGLAGLNLEVREIRRRFRNSGREDVSITYGGLVPSMTRLIRRLTRGTRS